jgi:hypothetical protein
MHCTAQHATWSPTYSSTHRAWHDFCHCAMFLPFMYLWTEGHVHFTRQDMNEWMWNLTILMYPLVGTSFGRGHLHFTQHDTNEWMNVEPCFSLVPELKRWGGVFGTFLYLFLNKRERVFEPNEVQPPGSDLILRFSDLSRSFITLIFLLCPKYTCNLIHL